MKGFTFRLTADLLPFISFSILCLRRIAIDCLFKMSFSTMLQQAAAMFCLRSKLRTLHFAPVQPNHLDSLSETAF